MALWKMLLRVVGTVLFLVGVIGGFVQLPGTATILITNLYLWALLVVISAALFALCFAAAAALNSLGRMEARIMRATSARRKSDSESTAPKDLAPVAPNWPEPKYAVRPARWEQRARRSERMGMDDEFDKVMLARRQSKRQILR